MTNTQQINYENLSLTQKMSIVEEETFNMIAVNDLFIDSISNSNCEDCRNKYSYVAVTINNSLSKLSKLF